MKTFTFFLALFLAFTVITAEDNEEQWFASSINPFDQKKRDISAKITFFEGHSLDNAACYGRDGLPEYDAKSTDFIGAMTGLNNCYKCLEITNPKNKKKVVVKIIDKCAGCKKNQVDLTRTAFSKIANPDDGIVNIKFRAVSCPSKGRFPTFEKKKKKKQH